MAGRPGEWTPPLSRAGRPVAPAPASPNRTGPHSYQSRRNQRARHVRGEAARHREAASHDPSVIGDRAKGAGQPELVTPCRQIDMREAARAQASPWRGRCGGLTCGPDGAGRGRFDQAALRWTSLGSVAQVRRQTEALTAVGRRKAQPPPRAGPYGWRRVQGSLSGRDPDQIISCTWIGAHVRAIRCSNNRSTLGTPCHTTQVVCIHATETQFLHQGTPPSARYDFRMMAVNSSLYLFGGYGATGVRRSEIWFLSLSELWRGDARPLRCAQNLLHLSDFVRNGEWRGMCAFTRGNAILRLHACEYDLYLQWIPPLQQAHMSSAKRRLHCCRNDSDACHVVCLDC